MMFSGELRIHLFSKVSQMKLFIESEKKDLLNRKVESGIESIEELRNKEATELNNNHSSSDRRKYDF